MHYLKFNNVVITKLLIQRQNLSNIHGTRDPLYMLGAEGKYGHRVLSRRNCPKAQTSES